jgi:hypothetical protein
MNAQRADTDWGYKEMQVNMKSSRSTVEYFHGPPPTSIQYNEQRSLDIRITFASFSLCVNTNAEDS